MNPIIRLAAVAVIAAAAVGGAIFVLRPSATVGPPQPSVIGTWSVSFSREEMIAAGLVDAAEDDPSNYGRFWLTFRGDTFQTAQLNAPGGVVTGSFSIRGGTLTLNDPVEGSTFPMPFTLTDTTLSFGKGGPVTYRVKPWTRLGASASPGASPTVTQSAYTSARNSICVSARTPRATLDQAIGSGLTDPATSAAVRAQKLAAFKNFLFFETTLIDQLDALAVPPGMAADEAANISVWRQSMSVLNQMPQLIEAGKLSDADALDAQTTPLSSQEEQFEVKYGLEGCP